MTPAVPPIRGGCLCGRVRYEATGEPIAAGLCYCGDCRRASGSAFSPFLLYPADRLRITGETLRSEVASARGGPAVRSHCAACGGLVFGGMAGLDAEHTIYAGSLDDPDRFVPRVALFVRDKPAWVEVPAGLKTFATMPGVGEPPTS